jgi:predicted dehydrogenase
VAAGLTGLASESWTQAADPSGALRLGVIGVGHRGRDLIRAFMRSEQVRVTALCDTSPSRLKVGRFLARQETADFQDYRRMLDESEIDAVVVASPLHLHAEHTLAALDHHRHVYCEIALAHTIDQCRKMAEAVRRTGKVLQVGHQYRYAPWIQESVSCIRKGELGQVQRIHAAWHRNHDGRQDTSRTDPAAARLANWRLYSEFSGGPLADVGCHQLDLANWIFEASPETVLAAGGVDFWKDDRDIPDNVTAVFRYPEGRTLVFSALTTNSMEGTQTRVFGTDGTLVLTNADATLYWEPRTDHSAHVAEAPNADAFTGATRKHGLPYRGPGEPLVPAEGEPVDPDQLACAAFVKSVRQQAHPEADVAAGQASAEWACRATQALAEGRPVSGEAG